MAMASILYSIIILLLSLPTNHVHAKPILEDGYTVKTLIDGHVFKINPHAVLPLPGSSDLLVLDSTGSSFYTVSFPIFQEIVVEPLSGDGKSSGYSDGELGSARFNKPKSFAVDLKGNVYVADKLNKVIRKISSSGVSTIAGGLSQRTGNDDGPAQNATFSNSFEVVFFAKKCALLILDQGNQLVRQIDLKPEDCEAGSQSAVGGTSVWIFAAVGVVSCLFGLAIGIVIQRYVGRTGTLHPPSIQQHMEALPNYSSEISTDTLLRHQKRNC